ncbi:uncharacterized protein HMPREF1541_02966 [Cyphellophora europaea CBS 101466]|uniref:Peptidase M20 dimerisation domain-containing protein n=1 Tax=Cyphellophora europaea (strain CBS 101466) TaxID=1220924 RepID=W2RX65_CYPE1|nr:uncharacterized protein HMPREF1541_02966 [Cyphellophora europaea CBS 101466]ETN41032.1 hypothetical protein HMPREF1541_02966 [Cyphellophora europaea CBS 101466]
MDQKQFLALVDADRDSHISFLQTFIRAPSPNPPGDTTDATNVILEYLKDRGIPSETIAPQPQMPNVVSTFSGASSGETVVMNGHIDVFPVADDTSDWIHPPWSGHNDGKYIHGRGGVDMKAGTAASVIAYSYLYSFRQHLKGSVTLACVSDEETGGKWGSRYLLEHDPRCRGDVMINAEPGGLQSIRFGEKGTLRLTFTVQTKGAHGAYVHLSEGANNIVARLITALHSIEEIDANIDAELRKHMQREDVRDVLDEVMGKGAADIVMKPTVNIGTVHGGLKVNMIPDKSIMEADIRLPIGLTHADVLDHIRNHILPKFPEATMSVQEAASNPPNNCPASHRMIDSIVRAAETATGRKPLAIPSLGATDTKFWRYRGIPAYVFGVSPETMAATNERVSIDEFLAVVKTHAAAVWEYLGGH